MAEPADVDMAGVPKHGNLSPEEWLQSGGRPVKRSRSAEPEVSAGAGSGPSGAGQGGQGSGQEPAEPGDAGGAEGASKREASAPGVPAEEEPVKGGGGKGWSTRRRCTSLAPVPGWYPLHVLLVPEELWIRRPMWVDLQHATWDHIKRQAAEGMGGSEHYRHRLVSVNGDALPDKDPVDVRKLKPDWRAGVGPRRDATREASPPSTRGVGPSMAEPVPGGSTEGGGGAEVKAEPEARLPLQSWSVEGVDPDPYEPMIAFLVPSRASYR